MAAPDPTPADVAPLLRWLARRDARIRAEALREASYWLVNAEDDDPAAYAKAVEDPEAWLQDRADRIKAGEQP